MTRLFLGEAHNRDKCLIMDMRMLHFGAAGGFIKECGYSVALVSKSIREVNGLSVLSCTTSPTIEIAYIIGGRYGTFQISGRLTAILEKLYRINGFCDTFTRHSDQGYIQSFLVYDVTVPLTIDMVKSVLTR